jgi:hypothetical protein
MVQDYRLQNTKSCLINRLTTVSDLKISTYIFYQSWPLLLGIAVNSRELSVSPQQQQQRLYDKSVVAGVEFSPPPVRGRGAEAYN